MIFIRIFLANKLKLVAIKTRKFVNAVKSALPLRERNCSNFPKLKFQLLKKNKMHFVDDLFAYLLLKKNKNLF